MKILIVAATKNEISPLLSVLEKTENKQDRYYCGSYQSHKITILIAGIGMTSTSYYTCKAFAEKFDLSINMGICGSFNTNLDIGSVVNIYEDCFAELGAEDDEQFLTLSEMNLEGVQKIQNLKFKIQNDVIEKLPKVNGITVNKVHGNEKSIGAVFNKFHPIVESMEGAAFMFVCEQEEIPYIQIRTVSNYVEKRNKEHWNIPLAIKQLNEKIIQILDTLQPTLTTP